jgi:hypothetical protein
MRVYINLENRAFVVSPTLLQQVSTLFFTRRDNEPVEVQFVRAGAVVELHGSAIGKMGLKSAYSSGYLAYAANWVKSGAGANTIYTFALNLNTPAVDGLFPLDTEELSNVKVQVEWEETGRTSSTLPTSAVIYNDLIRGNSSVFTITTLSSFNMASANHTFTITVDDDGVLTTTRHA